MKRTINDLPFFQRPREKLLEKGAVNVSDTELLALVIGTGSKKYNAISLAKKILEKFPFKKIGLPTIESLISIDGIGIKKACSIIAVYELASRWSVPINQVNIYSQQDVLFQASTIRNKHQEHLQVLFLNARSQLVSSHIVAIGRLNHLNIEPRDVFSPAFATPCIGIILVHNHPSNDPKPSKDDLSFTEKMSAAGKLLGLTLIDHVIVTKDAHYSFRENELLGDLN